MIMMQESSKKHIIKIIMPKIIFKKIFVGVRILCRTITTLTRLNELNKSTICEKQ